MTWQLSNSFLRRGRGKGGAELFSLGSSGRMHGNTQSYISEGSAWTLGNISLPRLWPNNETGSLERWLMPQAHDQEAFEQHP